MDDVAISMRLEQDQGLRGARIEAIDMPSVPEAPLTFGDCAFVEAHFDRSVLLAARFENCTFERCTFERVELNEARFDDCSFYAGPLEARAAEGCRFRHCVLDEATFTRCDLSLCEWQQGSAWNLVLNDCTAQGLNVAGVNFTRHFGRRASNTAFTARRCNLAFAALTGLHLEGAVLNACRLREAVLDDVDLTAAALQDSDLSAIEARRSTLRGADLRGAMIGGLDPSKVDLTGARILALQAPALLEALGLEVED